MAGAKGRSGGWRPGSGQKPKYPRPPETRADFIVELLRGVQRALAEQEARLADIQRAECGPLLLKRLIEIERRLGMREAAAPPHHSRRRPLGVDR